MRARQRKRSYLRGHPKDDVSQSEYAHLGPGAVTKKIDTMSREKYPGKVVGMEDEMQC